MFLITILLEDGEVKVNYPISEREMKHSMLVALSYIRPGITDSSEGVLRSSYLCDSYVSLIAKSCIVVSALANSTMNAVGALKVQDIEEMVYGLVYETMELKSRSRKGISRVLMKTNPMHQLVESVSQRLGLGFVSIRRNPTRIVADLGFNEGDLVKAATRRVLEEVKPVCASLIAYRKSVEKNIKATRRYVDALERQWPLAIVVRLDHVQRVGRGVSACEVDSIANAFVDNLRRVDVNEDLLGVAYRVDYLPEMAGRLHGIYFVKPDCSHVEMRELIARAWSESINVGFTAPYALRHQCEWVGLGEGGLIDVKRDLLQRMTEMVCVDEAFSSRSRSSFGFEVRELSASLEKEEPFKLIEVTS